MKRLFFAATLALALSLTLTPAPASAQSTEPTAEELESLGSLFGDMFGVAEPLSPEQEARLGEAMVVVTKLFPEGTYAKMMNESMAPMMEGVLGGLGGSPAITLTALTGIDPFTLTSVEDEKLAEAVALLDPASAQRTAAISDAMFSLISEVVVEVEPAYRSGLARAYAVRFSAEELADLSVYFDTPVGKKYAAESFLIFADPQVMASMNDIMPAMMQRMPSIMEMMEDAAGEYPEGRTFSALSAEEREKLASLLGVSVEELADAEPAGTSTGF